MAFYDLAFESTEYSYLTASQKKRKRKAAKLAQNFENNPPRCGNCENFSPPKLGVVEKHAFVEPRCKIGDFVCWPKSICDAWVGRDGETIED